MYITEFKLKEDSTYTYYEAFASHKKEDALAIKVRIVPTPTAHSLLIRDYETGVLLDEKRLTPYLLSHIVKVSAIHFGREYLNRHK